MISPLTADQHLWVEHTLATMSVAEKVGHLLCVDDRSYTVDEWRQLVRDVPIGSAFFCMEPPERPLACIQAIQAESRLPILIASDLEHGAGACISTATRFPFPMALGAAGSPALARAMGRATAREGRSYGVHWTFSPVVDLNLNHQNPVTNVRSIGDDPERVAPLAAALVAGIQDTGEMAATAKHFPGDGCDDRDQHICTSINSLSVADWWSRYGIIWQAVIESGVQAIMVGHISFPAYEGLVANPATALPATLSPSLQIELLRQRLSFQGVVISDAAPMIGLASRVSRQDAVVANLLAGSDVFLFAEPRADFARLLQALDTGELSLQRVDESVRRVLAMKARLGLPDRVWGSPLTSEDHSDATRSAQSLAIQAVTLLRGNAHTPLRIAPGSRVLTVSVVNVRSHGDRWDPLLDLPVVDDELRRRGFEVTHVTNPHGDDLLKAAEHCQAAFVNVLVYPHALFGSIRLTAELAHVFWRGSYQELPQPVFTSFGSPYLLYELPHLPNLYLTYGWSEASQVAAVAAWLGEFTPTGLCPVRMPVQAGSVSR